VPEVGGSYSKTIRNAQTCGSFEESETRSPLDASRIFTVPELLLLAHAGAIDSASDSASVATPAPSSARRVGFSVRDGRG